MDIEIACGTVIRDDVEIVYSFLLQCDTWPSVEEIMAETGEYSQDGVFSRF